MTIAFIYSYFHDLNIIRKQEKKYSLGGKITVKSNNSNIREYYIGPVIKITGNIFEYQQHPKKRGCFLSLSTHLQDVACFSLRAKIAGDLMRICCWRTREREGGGHECSHKHAHVRATNARIGRFPARVGDAVARDTTVTFRSGTVGRRERGGG